MMLIEIACVIQNHFYTCNECLFWKLISCNHYSSTTVSSIVLVPSSFPRWSWPWPFVTWPSLWRNWSSVFDFWPFVRWIWVPWPLAAFWTSWWPFLVFLLFLWLKWQVFLEVLHFILTNACSKLHFLFCYKLLSSYIFFDHQR